MGALGFREAVTALAANRLVCVDEFELDDPGDTVLMARLLRELADAGVRLAATSNTLPDALGEGRFAADDFLREIRAVAGHFEVVRIDGEDYRHRGDPVPPEPVGEAELADVVAGDAGRPRRLRRPGRPPGRECTPAATARCSTASRWRSVAGVEQVEDQNVALRLVVLVDRMYDRDVVLRHERRAARRSVHRRDARGGYRKKYRRALSRLTAMARAEVPPAGP